MWEGVRGGEGMQGEGEDMRGGEPMWEHMR